MITGSILQALGIYIHEIELVLITTLMTSVRHLVFQYSKVEDLEIYTRQINLETTAFFGSNTFEAEMKSALAEAQDKRLAIREA
jgi:hypothetical protein